MLNKRLHIRKLSPIRSMNSRSLRTLNIFLAVILASLCLANVLLKPYQGSPVNRLVIFYVHHIDTLAKTTGILIDVVSVMALLGAGIWAYYRFRGERTFAERVNIEVEKASSLKSDNLTVFRIVITNIGKVKIVPIKVDMEASSCLPQHRELEFEIFEERSDLLESNYDKYDPHTSGLEPGTSMLIDIPLRTRRANHFSTGELLLRITAGVTIATRDYWQVTKMFVLDRHTPTELAENAPEAHHS